MLDGVHRGHRRLLAALDPGLRRTVLTFEPHPVEVLRPGPRPVSSPTLDERVRLFGGAGVDMVGVLDLNAIKEQSPDDFVSAVLVDKMAIGHARGRGGLQIRQGPHRRRFDALRPCPECGFELDVVGISVRRAHRSLRAGSVASIESGDV